MFIGQGPPCQGLGEIWFSLTPGRMSVSTQAVWPRGPWDRFLGGALLRVPWASRAGGRMSQASGFLDVSHKLEWFLGTSPSRGLPQPS